MEFPIDTIDTTALTKAKLSEVLFDQLGLNMRVAADVKLTIPTDFD